jgi:hypothetical protein
MKVGVGYCSKSDAFASGRIVAETAMANGDIENPNLVIAFCHGQLDADEFLKGLRSVVGITVPIIGGSAVGIITNDHLSYDGSPAGAAILQSDKIECQIGCGSNLDKDERKAGRELAENLSHIDDGNFLLIFYDSIKVPPTATTPPVMNASPLIINGIEGALRLSIPILGAGVLGDFDFKPTKQFCGSYAGSQLVVGALFGGDLHHYYSIMHGCSPKDGIYHTITKMEGPAIYEVDGRPVVEMIDEMYGNKEWQTQLPVRRLTIGVNYGAKYGEYKEGEYVNRLIAGVMPEGRGIVIFEPDLEVGTEILFMLRDSRQMMESAKQNTEKLLIRIKAEGRKPVFGLYIDCAGRTAAVSETLTEEASEVRDLFKQSGIPLLGFYSGVEVAPLLGKSRGLDWTGVLWVIAQ